jgi:hypothetical protein
LEPTSGTSSRAKLIPFTENLQNEFSAAVAPWLYAMANEFPSISKGTAYWSLSPAGTSDRRVSRGGVPIGFPNDSEYLENGLGRALSAGFAVPPSVGQLNDTELWRLATAAFLLKDKRLSLVSVWNPSFLSVLFDFISGNLPRLLDCLRRGTFGKMGRGNRAVEREIAAAFGAPDPGRADELERIFSAADGAFPSAAIWPKLKILSCWAHAAAEPEARRLAETVAPAKLIPKGLLATEGVVSIPLDSETYPVLAVNSHFYEFIPELEPDRTVFAWELEAGGRYRVVLTTGGGLYRYDLSDMVEVRGFFGKLPTLEFVGRIGNVSDFHGEKLSEEQVESALKKLFNGAIPEFALMAPDGNAPPKRYILFVAGAPAEFSSAEEEESARGLLDETLRKANFHYDHCRRLGQLEKADVVRMGHTPVECHRRFAETVAAKRGIRMGDVKPAFLTTERIDFDERV